MADILEIIKQELNQIPQEERSVEIWNTLRKGLKTRFPESIIKVLDASGFIVTWLGSKAMRGRDRMQYNRSRS